MSVEQRFEEPEIHPHGFWIGPSPHYFDRPLADSIVTYFRREMTYLCYDLGCGDGSYVRHFNDRGIKTIGFDNNPEYEDDIFKADLTEKLDIRPLDVVLCLEVGEHIPEQFQDVFLDNVTRLATKRVILSWGIPDQEGHGHVNCRTNNWVKVQMAQRGWRYEAAPSNDFRKAAELWWFRDTIMVFSKFEK